MSPTPDELSHQLSKVHKVVQETAGRTEKIDHGITAIKESFLKLFEVLNTGLDRLYHRLANLERLPELFRDLQTSVCEELGRGALRQFETQLVGLMAGIMSNEQRIGALEQHRQASVARLEQDLEQVRGRYGTIERRLAEGNHERRRQLDSHAYALLEEIYPLQVLARLTDVSSPAFELLAAHALQASRSALSAPARLALMVCLPSLPYLGEWIGGWS